MRASYWEYVVRSGSRHGNIINRRLHIKRESAGARSSGLQRAAGLSGNSPLYVAQIAVAQASAGRKTEALHIVAQLQALASKRYVSPYGIAQIYAALNDKQQAFKWLQIAQDDRAVWISYLAVDPVFDGFRSDQRLQDLLRRVRLLP